MQFSLEDDVGRATSSAQLTVILIADALVRIALKQLLREADEVVVVGETAPGQELPVAGRTAPDVALVDSQGVDGLAEFLQRLQAVSPRTRAIILSEADFDCGLLSIACAGAWGYLRRDISGPQLIKAVRLVAQGKAVMDCTMAYGDFARLGQLRRADPPTGTSVPLSPKEASVIRIMAEGHTDLQIAEQLGLSIPTVKTHVRAILRKTNSRNRAAAVATAFRTGALR
jgi:DNA-binding NarL/FixJ family response regulator